MIAYWLGGHDNGSDFFIDPPPGVLCPDCSCCLDRTYYPTKLRMKRKYDIGSTYDNRCIVSERFKLFCEEELLDGLIFARVRTNPNFYYLTSSRIIEFDTNKNPLKIGPQCPLCKNIVERCGVCPIFLKNCPIPLSKGIYQTDLGFGTRSAKEPIHIVDVETQKKMKLAHFKGIWFEPIYNDYQPFYKNNS